MDQAFFYGTLLLLLLLFLRKPLGQLIRLAGRTLVSLGALALFTPIGQWLGSALGVNLFNALVLGILGIPGLGLLLLLRWALR